LYDVHVGNAVAVACQETNSQFRNLELVSDSVRDGRNLNPGLVVRSHDPCWGVTLEPPHLEGACLRIADIWRPVQGIALGSASWLRLLGMRTCWTPGSPIWQLTVCAVTMRRGGSIMQDQHR
jgi:hypothetical protein